MMIVGLVMAVAMLDAVGTHPPPTMSPPPLARLGPVLFPGAGEDMKTEASEVRSSQTTVEYGRITTEERQRACNNHCRLLRGDCKGGECIDGRCHCKKKAEEITCKESCPTHCKSLGREGLCVEGVCHCHDIELKCERHESCSSHCLTLGHTDSQCQEGICRCGLISHDEKRVKRPHVRKVTSVGEKRRNHDELHLITAEH